METIILGVIGVPQLILIVLVLLLLFRRREDTYSDEEPGQGDKRVQEVHTR